MGTGPSDRRLIVLLGALSAFGPLSMDMYLPGLPSLTRDFGASASSGQLTLTACMLGIAGGQLLVGPLSDARGRRAPLLTGLLGYVVASAACAAAPSIETLIVLRFLQGTFGGAGVVIARAIVRDLFEGAAAARVYALLMAVMGVAPVFAPLVGGQALAVTSWRGIFVVLAAIGVPLFLGALLWLPETLGPERRHGGGLISTVRVFGRLVRDRSFMPAATSFSLAAAAMFAYIAGASFVLEDVYGISPQVFSLVFALNSAGLIGFSQLGGRLVHRVGAAVLLRLALCGAAAGALAALVVILAHAGLAPLLVSLFVMLSFSGMVYPNATAVALADQGGRLGSASALLGMGQFGTGAVLAPAVGLGGSHDALPMGILIGVCGVSALAVNLVFGGRQIFGSGRRARLDSMTEITSHAYVATDKPVAYMRQLCKHFGHKTDASFGEDSGYIQFEFGRCELRAANEILRLQVSAPDGEQHERMERVVGSHLERFGRRDGLTVTWQG